MTHDIPIAELAARHGLTHRTLRHYEALELLKPHRTDTGKRLYSEADSDRVERIVIYKAMGLSLEGIRRKLLADDSCLWLTPAEAEDLLLRQRMRIEGAKAAMARIRSITRLTEPAEASA